MLQTTHRWRIHLSRNPHFSSKELILNPHYLIILCSTENLKPEILCICWPALMDLLHNNNPAASGQPSSTLVPAINAPEYSIVNKLLTEPRVFIMQGEKVTLRGYIYFQSFAFYTHLHIYKKIFNSTSIPTKQPELQGQYLSTTRIYTTKTWCTTFTLCKT